MSLHETWPVVSGIIEGFLAKKNSLQTVNEVSEARPLVFFHERKAGGRVA